MDINQLLEEASGCAAAGDIEGELEAYRRADELGDADAAIFLGNALRRVGKYELARSAYARAEERGHREAAMALGNLLGDTGDTEGAKSAYLRSIGLGSRIASLNLGLMLAENGETDAALDYLLNAAEAGECGGYWGMGKIYEQRADWVSAADAYRRGDELGDPECSLGLGIALLEQGEMVRAREALQRSSERGNSKAVLLLEVFDAPPARQGADRLWENVGAAYPELASHRRELGGRWATATRLVEESQSRLETLKTAEARYLGELSTSSRRFNTHAEVGSNPTFDVYIPDANSASWLQAGQRAGTWELADVQRKAFDSDLTEARTQLAKAERRSLAYAFSPRKRGREALGRVAKRVEGLTAAIAAATGEVSEAERSRHLSMEAALRDARQAFDPVVSLATESALALPPVLQSWSSSVWSSWSLDDQSSVGLRVAYGGLLTPKPDHSLGPNAAFGTDLRVPFGFALHASHFVMHDRASRVSAHGFARSILLRQLVSTAPGGIRFCIFDPVGLGQSVGDLLDLAEYDADLIGGKVWSSPQDLDARLTELNSHIELVIQKYLRTTYESIDDFNDAAGEVAESYRLLVLFDFPSGITADTCARLKSVVENGPRCGVFTMIIADMSTQVPYGVDLDQLTTSMVRLNLQRGFVDEYDGYKIESSFEHDVLPDHSEVAKKIVDAIGRASVGRAEAAVTFDKVFGIFGNVARRGLRPELGTAGMDALAHDPGTWWSADSTGGLFAPIGQKGARDVAILGFDSGDHAGALLVGRPGSGKSTLLHAYIGGLTTLYGPEELELYLIDFKEGVEFKAYAEERLPHAKVIAIESDREFGLSVLESIQAEITQRAEVLRATGGRHAGMQGLRQATGQKIPRILLVFDEFQVLFARNDKVGLAAADLVESIVRQGRGFGVHVLLGSQSLSGLDALGAHVPQLLPVRILLAAAETDARKVLGDTNTAGDYLTSHGEGILNAAGGAVEANERFKGALLTEADRTTRLRLMRQKAGETGFARVPMVFEGNSLVPLETQSPSQFREELSTSGAGSIRIRSGKPMTVGDLGDVTLTREDGENVLTIARAGDIQIPLLEDAHGIPYGLVAAAVASVAVTDAAIDLVDFMPNDDGMDSVLEPFLDVQRITLRRRRAFPDVLADFLRDMTERVADDDVRRPARLLFLFGIHRARDLMSDIGGLDVDVTLVEQLEQIMQEGPMVGIHVWIWSDSVPGASRRLTPRMMREISWRIAGKMSSDDSQTFIGSSQAANLRESQLLIVNDDHGISTRVTGFAPPPGEWVASIARPSRTG